MHPRNDTSTRPSSARPHTPGGMSTHTEYGGGTTKQGGAWNRPASAKSIYPPRGLSRAGASPLRTTVTIFSHVPSHVPSHVHSPFAIPTTTAALLSLPLPLTPPQTIILTTLSRLAAIPPSTQPHTHNHTHATTPPTTTQGRRRAPPRTPFCSGGPQ